MTVRPLVSTLVLAGGMALMAGCRGTPPEAEPAPSDAAVAEAVRLADEDVAAARAEAARAERPPPPADPLT